MGNGRLLGLSAFGKSAGTVRVTLPVAAHSQPRRNVVMKPAHSWDSGSGTDTCATIAHSSYGTSGVWIRNECDPDVVGVQWVDLVYRLTLPPAHSYGTLTLWAYGHTHPSGIYAPLVRVVGGIETTAHAWTDGSLDVRGTTGAWRRLLALPATGRVSAARQVMVRVSVPNYWTPPPNEFDARTVKVTVTARVLR